MNNTEMTRVIHQLMSLFPSKIHYSWRESRLHLKLVAEIDQEGDTDKSTIAIAPNLPVVERIAEWCYNNRCGRRTSYDTFKFRNRKQITLFLLRWGEVKDE